MPNYLSHHSGWYPSDIPESWHNRQPGLVPYFEGLPRHFGGLSLLQWRFPYDPGGGPSFPGRDPPGLPGPPHGPLDGGPLVLLEVVVPLPLVTQGLKAHPDSHSCGKVVLH